MLCVQSGLYKRRRLYSHQQLNIRPTRAMVRQAIFSILKSRFELADFTFCDMFAGSGAVGIEAYSCGAKEVLFLEKEPKHCDLIHRNLRHLDIEQQCKVRCINALEWLQAKHLKTNRVLFLDPPRDSSCIQQAITQLKHNLEPFYENLILIEQAIKIELDFFGIIQVIHTKNYGKTQIILGKISN